MEKQTSSRARVRANNALWAAIRAGDANGVVAALGDGANPDVQRQGRTPAQALVGSGDVHLLLGAWPTLEKAWRERGSGEPVVEVSALARALLSGEAGMLERVWGDCAKLRKSLVRACMNFRVHRDAGILPEHWPDWLARVAALEGSHHALGGQATACFGGDWHHGGFDFAVVEQLVAFDLDPRRVDGGVGGQVHSFTQAFCQAVALYDDQGMVVGEICRNHQDWLTRDGGINGHALVEQLIKYGENQKYFRLHVLAPHLVGPGTPSGLRAMAAACLECSITCLMDGFDADPGAALARQGFSLDGAFERMDPSHLHGLVRNWQQRHWGERDGNNQVERVVGALDRLAGFGLDVRGAWGDVQASAASEWREVAGSLHGVGLMHLWCAADDIQQDTGGEWIQGLDGFERIDGPSLLEVATRAIEKDPAHGAFVLPSIRALNWALSCGADVRHPGAVVAGERVLFALVGSGKPVSDRHAGAWVAAVDWMIGHGVQMPHVARMDELDRIVFERPAGWREQIDAIKLALVEANHGRMLAGTAMAGMVAGPRPRL